MEDLPDVIGTSGREYSRDYQSSSSRPANDYEFLDRNLLETFAESFLDPSYHMMPYSSNMPKGNFGMPSLSSPEALEWKLQGEQFNQSAPANSIPPLIFNVEEPKPSNVTAAKERRRERNKVLARKTRLKKKAELETMRDKVLSLLVENEKLRDMVQQHLPILNVKSLVSEDLTLPENIMSMIQQMISDNEKANMNEISIKQRSFCLVNPNAHDFPIVYASPGFIHLTGYSREECIGRNCRFLQGPDTDPTEVKAMKEALTEQQDISVVLLNYHKSGAPFWNKIELAHLRNDKGEPTFIIGVQSQCGAHCIRTRLARRKAMTIISRERRMGLDASRRNLSSGTLNTDADGSTPPMSEEANATTSNGNDNDKDSEKDTVSNKSSYSDGSTTGPSDNGGSIHKRD